ncbi:MAG: Abi-alpha family protein [Mycobacterium sp.]
MTHDREPGRDENPLSALIDPLAQLGIDTARDLAAAVQSTRAAGRDLWRLANVLNRIPGRDAGAQRDSVLSPAHIPALSAADDPDDDSPEDTASLPATTAPAAGPGIVGGLKRAAETILNPGAVLGVAVSPVRRIVAPDRGTKTDTDIHLRAVGDQLIAASQQPAKKPPHRHPAFGHILEQLSPDESRIVRFLAVAGPQPAIDIRTKTLFQVGSERLAAGVNMIAEMAGCRWPEFDDRYLVNLNRLGLVRFSTEPVADYRRYALLEVQPRALEAAARAASTISVYRSIYLSTFGQQFCDVCIDTTGYNAGGWASDERGDKIIGKGPPDPAKAGHKH